MRNRSKRNKQSVDKNIQSNTIKVTRAKNRNTIDSDEDLNYLEKDIMNNLNLGEGHPLSYSESKQSKYTLRCGCGIAYMLIKYLKLHITNKHKGIPPEGTKGL